MLNSFFIYFFDFFFLEEYKYYDEDYEKEFVLKKSSGTLNEKELENI